jgi:ketosteroid isomerase-like protein
MLLAVFLLAVASTASPSDPAAQVKAAETAFAAAFAQRDQAKFFSHVAEDAVFLSPRETLTGKSQVVEGWSRFFQGETPPFSWRPERVVVNGAGDLGLSLGPIFDAAGKQIGSFSSVWRRQKDGSWKVVFDGPGSPVCPPAEKK